MMNLDRIPPTLRERPQWVVWRNALKDGRMTKLPYQSTGDMASSTDSTTWTTFELARAAFKHGTANYTGLGFVFSQGDELCGIDLDGCRDPQSGAVEAWAKQWILEFNSYAEVSPSGTGVKIWIVGKKPEGCGAKASVKDATKIGDKEPAVEVYDQGRYFAVTGERLQGMPSEPQQRQDALEKFIQAFFPKPTVARSTATYDFDDERAIAERARKYIARMPDAVSGQDGHGKTFAVACVLVKGFSLSREAALAIIGEWNIDHCQPQWSDRELAHKIDSALKAPGERGYLRLARQHTWDAVKVPEYREPKQRRFVTDADAVAQYITRLERGEERLFSLGIQSLDEAIGGGVGFGEPVVFSAPSNHCKSSFALHVVHHCSAHDIGCHVISSEMSAYLLGKRTLQTMLDGLSEHDYANNIGLLQTAAFLYQEHRKRWYIDDEAGNLDEVLKSIDDAVAQNGIKLVALDYVQMIEARGQTTFEAISKVSRALRDKAKEHQITILELCQMNQNIEKRAKMNKKEPFAPKPGDIEYGSQIFKDADVVMFGVWPWKADCTKPKGQYQFFIAKNRNRPIHRAIVQVDWDADRQVFSVPQSVRQTQKYDFD